MKIVSLTAENVKKLTAVHIVPDPKGGLVVISGKNGSGKSSCLDSIMYALGGKDTLPSKPVRKGEDKAKIELDLGEFTVTRTITPQGGGTLIVRNKDAQKVESPQTLLDSLFGKLTFDPLEFRSMKPDKRSETLQALVGLDFKAKDVEIDQVFTERTALNREVKSLENQLVAAKEYADAPAQEQPVSEIAEQQLRAAQANKENESKRQHVRLLRRELEEAKSFVGDVERQMADLQKRLDGARNTLKLRQKNVEDYKVEIPADSNLSAFVTRMADVNQANSKVRANDQKAKLRAAHKAKAKEADALTSKIEALEKQKRQALADAKYPVPGLALSNTREVEVSGIPFDEVNTADQLRVSVAMGLAMNPRLRVLLVRQGNDLDDDSLKLVAEMAMAADSQVWIERVNPSGEVAVIIEDGHVKEPMSIPSTSNEEPKTDTPTQKELV